MNLSTEEAKMLIDIEKILQDKSVAIPKGGETKTYNATDNTTNLNFRYTARQARGNNSKRKKASYNLMYKGTILLRVDTDGNGLHTNEDGSTIPPHTPHIHIYDEKEGDHNAYRLPACFSNPLDMATTLKDFFQFSNVININEVEIVELKELF